MSKMTAVVKVKCSIFDVSAWENHFFLNFLKTFFHNLVPAKVGIGYFVTVGLFCLILDLSNHTITSTLQKLFSNKNFLGLKVLSTEKRISKMIIIILHRQKNLHVDDANFNQCVERSRSALKGLIKIFIKKDAKFQSIQIEIFSLIRYVRFPKKG